jgi:tRNA-specific 2-thiouridylase
LGWQSKQETRQLAAKLGLSVASKPDSQEICFVPDNKYANFLSSHVPDLASPGPILDTEGNVLGEHRGIAFYTIGQRKGLGIAIGRPAYVVGIDKSRNAIIIGSNSELFRDTFVAQYVNLIAVDRLEGRVVVSAKIRYNMHDSPAEACSVGADRVQVRFAKPQRAITPGQSAVFYWDDVVVGGGVIADRDEVGDSTFCVGNTANTVR